MQNRCLPAGRDGQKLGTCGIQRNDFHTIAFLRAEHTRLPLTQTTAESQCLSSQTPFAANSSAHGGSICKRATLE